MTGAASLSRDFEPVTESWLDSHFDFPLGYSQSLTRLLFISQRVVHSNLLVSRSLVPATLRQITLERAVSLGVSRKFRSFEDQVHE